MQMASAKAESESVGGCEAVRSGNSQIVLPFCWACAVSRLAERNVHGRGLGHDDLRGRVFRVEAEVAGELGGGLVEDGPQREDDEVVRGLGLDRLRHELAQGGELIHPQLLGGLFRRRVAGHGPLAGYLVDLGVAWMLSGLPRIGTVTRWAMRRRGRVRRPAWSRRT